MTRHTSKNSLLEDYNNYDYDKNTLKGLCESFDNLLPSSVESKEKINIDQNRSENVKLLGCTTAAINGLIGIKGIVSSALHEPSGKIVAIKRYILEEDNEDINSCHTSQEKFNENTTFIMKEVIRMRQIRHSNILPVISSFVLDSDICIVMPMMRMGSARDVIDSYFPEGLPEYIITSIVRDVLSALVHLHSKSIIHRSIRASHILLDPDRPSAKLTGLRYACNLQDPPGQGLQERYDYPLHVVTTNLNWLSPEILQQNLCGYNEKSDVYSLAVTACEMANGLVPFSEMPGTLMLLEKLRGAAPKLLDKSTFDTEGPDILCDAGTENGCDNNLSNFGKDKFNYDQATERNEDIGLTADQQPGDSGVGVSVGSTNNMNAAVSTQMSQAGTIHALSSRASLYATRVFSDAFHDFVSDSSILEPSERPSAYELINSHPFIRHFVKKAGSEKAKNNESLISTFWSEITKKSGKTTGRHNVAQENSYKFQCGKGQSTKNSGDVEWVF